MTIEYPSAAEYISGDFEGDGLRFIGKYGNRDDAIRDVEEFLGRDIRGWRNYDEQPHTPTAVIETPFSDDSVAYFERLVRQRSVTLPRSAEFSVGGIYWEHIALWGEFREDRLGEETELRLRARGIVDDE
ncbi:MAG: hypothetical protein M3Y87_04425 [Myxococcota bacterium]|nr:hypothetical protein [Myxococcota bacterium]